MDMIQDGFGETWPVVVLFRAHLLGDSSGIPGITIRGCESFHYLGKQPGQTTIIFVIAGYTLQ